MNIGYAIELVIALAFGLGAWLGAYWNDAFPNEVDTWQAFFVEWVLSRGTVFLVGVSLVGGLGVMVESLRGRSPHPWGPGRWVWAITSLGSVAFGVQYVSYFYSHLLKSRDAYYGLSMFVSGHWIELTAFLVSLGITARLLGLPKSSRADAREWAGRLLGVMMIVRTSIDITEGWWRGY